MDAGAAISEESPDELRFLHAVYPSARLKDTVGGIILKPSPPPVPKPRLLDTSGPLPIYLA